MTSRSEPQLQIGPSPAFAGAQLLVTIVDSSVRPDQCAFEWRRNGFVIAEARSSVLEPGRFRRGDRIEVTVIVPASEPGGACRMEASVEVVNSPPVITGVTVASSTASGGAELVASPEGADPDGDPIRYTYRWFRNGTSVAAESGERIAMSAFAVGDQIAVEAVASDGRSESAPARAEAFPIENRPPHFTSQPVMPGRSDAVFQYSAAARDEDGDMVRYQLVDAPSGAEWDGASALRWELPAGAARAGDFAFSIRASDDHGGEAIQRFTIRLGQ